MSLPGGRLATVLASLLAAFAALIVFSGIEAGVERPEIIYAALISAFGTATTVLGGYLLWRLQHQAEAAREADRQAQRRVRLLIALRAELAECVKGQFAQFGPDKVAALKTTILKNIKTAQAGEHSMPTAVVKRGNDVYDNIVSEVADLPSSVIGATIRYYKLDRYVAEILIAFTDGKFEKLAKERRIDTVEMFATIGRQALEAGIAAFRAVDAHLDPDPDLAAQMDAIADAIRSNPARDSDVIR